MKTQVVDIEGSLFTVVVSDGAEPVSGQGVVFLHGLGARSERWAANLDSIAAETGLPVVAIDLLGHGSNHTRTLPDSDVVDLMSGQVRDVIQSLGIDRPFFVGTSLGGHVACKAALMGFKSVEGIVLVAPAGFVPLGSRAKGIADRVADMSVEGVRQKLENLVASSDLVTDEWIHEEHAINSTRPVADFLKDLSEYIRLGGMDKEILTDDECAELCMLRILVVWGEQDRTITVKSARNVIARLGGTPELLLIPEAAHAPYLEKPAVFNEAVSKFIRAGRSAAARILHTTEREVAAT